MAVKSGAFLNGFFRYTVRVFCPSTSTIARINSSGLFSPVRISFLETVTVVAPLARPLTSMKRKQVPLYRRNIGVVFQDFRLLKDKTVFENVAFAQRIIGRTKKEIIRNVTTMLTIVGLNDKADVYPDELSGGEQQRVAIARALVNQPPILLADEPTGNLDPQTAKSIMVLLNQLNKMGTTVVVVTHNDELVDMLKKRVIRLDGGAVVNDKEKGGYYDEGN